MGAIRHKFETDQPPELDIGDALVLGDGSKVIVIGTDEQISGEYYEHTIYVGTSRSGERQVHAPRYGLS